MMSGRRWLIAHVDYTPMRRRYTDAVDTRARAICCGDAAIAAFSLRHVMRYYAATLLLLPYASADDSCCRYAA